MRKYYLFLIKQNSKEIYLKNNLVLYQTLFNLYKLKLDDCRIGISIFNQICDIFNKEIIINYMKDKYNLKIKDKYLLTNTKENILIKLNHSCVIIITDCNIPNILKTLYLYSKNIFVVDFQNEDYFWLSRETFKK